MATLLEFAGVHYFTKVISNIIFEEFAFVLNLLWKSLSLKSKQSKYMVLSYFGGVFFDLHISAILHF